MAAAMLATPMVGTAQAWGWRCRGGESQDFNVTLLPDYLGFFANTESIFIPSETDPCLAIFKATEVMAEYTITVGDNDPYVLGEDFEYSGTMISIVYKPDLATLAGTFTFGERMIWRWWYQYDFSAGSSGLEGKLCLYAYLKWESGIPTESKVCSIWGTGDFRCVKIDATINIAAGGAHEGTVTGWPE
jgi:hypothetical protein